MKILRNVGITVLLAVFAACNSASNDSQTKISVAGSTALQPLVEQAATDYMAKHPGLTIDVKGGGSGKGIFEVTNHSVDIGNSDVDAASADLIDHQVAAVAFAIVHGPDTGVESLTNDQVVRIFNGSVTNWKQIGGRDLNVVVVNRPLGSGTRKVFSTFFMSGREPANIGTVIESSEQVAQKVKNTPGAISYVALSYAQKFNVPTMTLGGVLPSVPNIRNHTYGFWSYEHMYTTAKSSPAAEAFIEYVRSDDAALDRLGFIALKDIARVPNPASTTQ